MVRTRVLVERAEFELQCGLQAALRVITVAWSSYGDKALTMMSSFA
jgi:hypothetical protein